MGSPEQHVQAKRETGPSALDAGFLQILLDHTNDIVIVVDANGTIRYARASANWVLGLDPDAQVGRNALEGAG